MRQIIENTAVKCASHTNRHGHEVGASDKCVARNSVITARVLLELHRNPDSRVETVPRAPQPTHAMNAIEACAPSISWNLQSICDIFRLPGPLQHY